MAKSVFHQGTLISTLYAVVIALQYIGLESTYMRRIWVEIEICKFVIVVCLYFNQGLIWTISPLGTTGLLFLSLVMLNLIL